MRPTRPKPDIGPSRDLHAGGLAPSPGLVLLAVVVAYLVANR